MSGPEPLEIALPAAPGPDDAGALVAALRTGLLGRPLIIDASQVEAMSGPVTLTLVSALETCADMTPPAQVKGATADFVDAFTDLGFFQEMMRMEFVG